MNSLVALTWGNFYSNYYEDTNVAYTDLTRNLAQKTNQISRQATNKNLQH